MIETQTLWKVKPTLAEFIKIRDMIKRPLTPDITIYLTENEYREKVRSLISSDTGRAHCEEHVGHCVCDVCRKPIEDRDHYYHVVTGHNGWGADSHESRTQHHLCSDECLSTFIKQYNEENKRENTRYAEIEYRQMFLSEQWID